MTREPFASVVAEVMSDFRRQPRLDSITLVREKYVDVVGGERVDRRGVLAFTFESDSGAPYRGLGGVDRSPDGSWHATGGASSKIPLAAADTKWLSVGSWTSGPGVSIGLWIARNDARSLRVIDADGRQMEDTIENGVALSIRLGDGWNLRASTAELLDSDGRVIESGPVWG